MENEECENEELGSKRGVKKYNMLKRGVSGKRKI